MTHWLKSVFRKFENSVLKNRRVGPRVESLEGRQLLSASVHHALKLPKFVKGSASYHDGSFINVNWQTTPVIIGNGGVSTGVRVATGGNGGAFRSVTDTVYGGAADSVIYGFHGNTKAVFNPATKGAITSLKYSESNKLISGFDEGESTGPALEQNGQIYLAIDKTEFIPQSNWKKETLTNLTAADFIIVGTTQHPDFSATAAPIEFGFFRGNSAGESGYTIIAGIDNWAIMVKTLKQK